MFGIILGTLLVGLIIFVFTGERAMKGIKRHAFQLGYHMYVHTKLGQLFTRRHFHASEHKFPNGHSETKTFTYGALHVTAVPYGSDNFAYVIIDETDQSALIIDCGYGVDRLLSVVQRAQANLLAVLITHKHWDHCLSVPKLHRRVPMVPIYGSEIDRPQGCTHTLAVNLMDPVELRFGHRLRVRAHATRGHTNGHLAYQINTIDESASEPNMLFTGDVLFIGAIGKLFEGSPDEMYDSLRLLTSLGDECLVWPGHEYASDNCAFALTVDPHNEALKHKIDWCKVQREESMPTCPSTIGEEKQYNPFVRVLFDNDFLEHLDANNLSTTNENHLINKDDVLIRPNRSSADLAANDGYPRKVRVAALAHLRALKDDFRAPSAKM